MLGIKMSRHEGEGGSGLYRRSGQIFGTGIRLGVRMRVRDMCVYICQAEGEGKEASRIGTRESIGDIRVWRVRDIRFLFT